MIKQESIYELLGKTQLTTTCEYLGIHLKVKGVTGTGKSPWSDEKTGSFHVHDTKNIWKDFSSGKGGGGEQASVRLVMEYKGWSWFDAVKFLAEKHNVVLQFEEETPEEKSGREQQKEKREIAEAVVKLAADWYGLQSVAEPFKNFCAERYIDEDEVAKWGLGWAPANDNHVSREVQRHGQYPVAAEIGIVKQKGDEDGTMSVYDALRSRVTIPIRDLYGRLVGFAGRFIATTDKDKASKAPKFINPVESFFYSKGKMLYGYHEAAKAIQQSGAVYVVEGYADVWAMHRAGLKNTVAHCGKFITSEQMKLLRRMCDKLIFLLEDKEALAGALKCIPEALKMKFQVEVCDLRLDGNKRDADDLWRSIAVGFSQEENKDVVLAAIRPEFVGTVLACTSDGVMFMAKQHEAAWSIPAQHGKVSDAITDLMMNIDDALLMGTYLESICRMYKGWSADRLLGDHKAIIDKKLADEKISDKEYNSTLKRYTKQSEDVREDWESLMKQLEKKIADKRKRQKQDKAINALQEKENDETVVSWDIDELMPRWVSQPEMKEHGFVQRDVNDGYYPRGVYFPIVNGMKPVYRGVERVTNYTIAPLFHIKHETNPRRMVEVNNGMMKHTIELPDKAMTSSSIWEEVMVNKGNFTSTEHFAKYHYIKLRNYISNTIEDAYEISTLGWQPKEGFFSWVNAVLYWNEVSEPVILPYDERGMVKIGGKQYLSMSVSNINAGNREDGGMYENDLYLKYVEGNRTFEEWAKVFGKVYDDHAPYGIAFVVLTIFKDVVYKIGQKMPLLYLYGPKGSGKSAFGESLQNLFYSGTNSEGRLIQAVNMTPGMVTPYAFYAAMGRFRNCLRMYNEWDPLVIEKEYRGFFKAAYDGEGRERGSGDSYAKKKTEIQKVQGTMVLAGQYLDMQDDGALMMRCVNRSFSEEKNRSRTDEQKALYKLLTEWEREGLTSAIVDVMKFRKVFTAQLEKRFISIKQKLAADAKKMNARPEERLLNNYSLIISAMDLLLKECGQDIGVNMDVFYLQSLTHMIELSAMLHENNVLTKFWREIEAMSHSGVLKHSVHYRVKRETDMQVRKAADQVETIRFAGGSDILVIQMSKLMAAYEKEMRARGRSSVGEATIIEYLKDQPYFIGLVKSYTYSTDIQSSGYALNYEELQKMVNVSLHVWNPDKDGSPEAASIPAATDDGELPF